jgi:dockerin type I repeat protein
MKKKSASQSAFFNLRLLAGVFIALAAIFMALLGLGVFSVASTAQAQPQRHKFIIDPNLGIFSPGFDCSKIHELGIDKQENMRAGAIIIACGEGIGGTAYDSETAISARSGTFNSSTFSRNLIKNLPSSPLFIGSADVDVVLPDGAFPHVTQSESMEWCGANNTCVVNYNDSRTAPNCYSGISYSSDGGATWHASQQLCSGHGTNFGDPIVVFNAHLNMWFAGDLATGCGGQGVGMWTSPDGITWTAGACAANTGSGDRESMWVDNNPASPFYGRMYVSFNDFAVGGALKVVYSDNGTTWVAPVTLNAGFIRDIQVTGDLQGGGNVYVASMNEGSGGGLQNRQNVMYRSTNGGVNWASSNAGPAFEAPGRVLCTANTYFVCMFGTDNWRHMGWGEPAANGSVVSLDYAACGQNVSCGGATDHGDIYYIRSTDAGLTWGTPVKLNTDTGTAIQWQPSLAATQAGALFASWYDGREVNGGADLNCTAGSSSQNCYRRWGRVSFDNGATWQPDDMVGRSLTPLPGQPDGGVQPNYQGDYDYHSSLATTIIGGWTDGRNIISGQSQQDVFVNFVTGGFGVISSVPACNSVINTQPTDFVINLSAAVDTTTVQASDFSVNGIPSNLTPTFSNSNATITFHFSTSPVTTQGPQTMHIPAGAFNDTSNHPVADFTCTFCYALTPLQVTSTNPPVNGTFSPPAPGDYSFDVNFNQQIDPSSVQTSDLTITGNVGGSVTAVTVTNGNTTAHFTIHFQFGGSVTLSIGAGAITANGCNGNAAFSGMYTVQGCPPQNHYTISQIGGSIVPGTVDTGNHADDGTTPITLPFSFTLYDQTYTTANVDSNGTLQFGSNQSIFTNTCLPDTSGRTYMVYPYWDDLETVINLSGCASYPGGQCGVFTSVSGTAPNRIFNIEWRAVYFANNASQANFEVRLYEGQSRYDVIYGTVGNGNTSATAGVQKVTDFDQYFCNGSGNPATGGQSYILQSCNTQVTGAVSRKTHGAAGTFDINMPLTGLSGVECRTGGATHDYSLVVTFSGNVTVTGMPQAQVVSGVGCVGTGGVCDPNGTVSVNGAVVTVPLTTMGDVQVANVQINGVNSASDEPAVNVNIPMGFLAGDVTGNRTVNASDVALTKSQVGQTVGAGNFREDVNANGTITATDVSIVKSDVGHSLP